MSYTSDPIKFAEAITPSDSTILLPTRAIWVGTAGNITVTMLGNGAVVDFPNVPVGWFPVQVTKVMAATTASNLRAGR